jgi:hypothetical protein
MKEDIVAEDIDFPATPEHILWLAVIDRAIADYCAPAQELTPYFKADLYNFFFDNVSRPYNLVYICSMLLDREDAVRKIRKRIANHTLTEKNRSFRSSSF